MYHHIRQVVVQDFCPNRSDFLGNHINWISFVFTVLSIHVKIKSLPICMSVSPSFPDIT